MFIFGLALINALIFAVFLYFHLQAKGFTECVTYTKTKTWMLFLIIIVQLSIFVRYLLYIYNEILYDWMLISTGFVQSIVFFLVCYFFTKKASQYLEDSSKTKRVLRIMFYVTLAIFAGVLLFQFFD